MPTTTGSLQHSLGTMHRFNVLVFDSDGVLASGGTALPMARELIGTLNERRFPYFVLTNGPFLCPNAKSERYAQMGLDIAPWRIIGSAHPLGDVLAQLPRQHGRLFVIASEDTEALLAKSCWAVDNSSLEVDGILLLDDDLHWDAQRVTDVLNLLLRRPGLPLIVPNPDLVFPDRPGRLFPTSGAWARLLTELCAARGVRVEPIFLGKPHAPIYRYLQTLLDRHHPGLARNRIAMLGDSPETDVLGANRQGWFSILIRTGNASFGAHPEGSEADLSFDDLRAFCRVFLPTIAEDLESD